MSRVRGAEPSVSVCIVTFNSAEHIGECLEAIERQTWPNLTVVVVDNDSRDSTVRILMEKAPYVKLIRNADNRGFAAGQNQAIASTDSDYVLVLNADVILERDYIENIVRVMEANPEIGSACGCLALKDDPATVDSTGLKMTWARKAVERGGGRPVADFAQSCEIFGVSGAAAVYARRMIDHISINGEFFDETFFAYKEDVDVAWRAQRLGWKAWYEASAKALHVRHWRSRKERKRIPLKVRKHSYQNRYLMIAKNETFDLKWWVSLPALLVYEAALNGYMLLRDPKVLTCWGSLCHLLEDAWRKRKSIQILSKSPNENMHSPSSQM